MRRFRSQKSAQQFPSARGSIYSLFNVHRHRVSRRAIRTFRNQAMAEWQIVTAAAQTSFNPEIWLDQIELS